MEKSEVMYAHKALDMPPTEQEIRGFILSINSEAERQWQKSCSFKELEDALIPAEVLTNQLFKGEAADRLTSRLKGLGLDLKIYQGLSPRQIRSFGFFCSGNRTYIQRRVFTTDKPNSLIVLDEQIYECAGTDYTVFSLVENLPQ